MVSPSANGTLSSGQDRASTQRSMRGPGLGVGQMRGPLM